MGDKEKKLIQVSDIDCSEHAEEREKGQAPSVILHSYEDGTTDLFCPDRKGRSIMCGRREIRKPSDHQCPYLRFSR